MTVYYRGIPKRSNITETPNSIIWVTDNPEYASEYGVVYELDIDDSNCASSSDVYDIAYGYGYTEDSELMDIVEDKDVQQELLENGYTMADAGESASGDYIYVILDSSIIKNSCKYEETLTESTYIKQLFENAGVEIFDELLLELKRQDAGKLLTIAENTLTNAVKTILNLALKPETKHNSYYIETDTYISYKDKSGKQVTVPVCVITDNYQNRAKNKNNTQPPSAGVKHFAQHILNISDVLYGCMHKRFEKDGSVKITTKSDLECFISAFKELENRLSQNTELTDKEVDIKNNKATIRITIPYSNETMYMYIVIGLPKNKNTDIAFLLTTYNDN